MKYFFIVLTVILCGISACKTTAIPAVATSTMAEDSVKTVINKMFTAMKAADGRSLKECFSDSIVFQTISRNKEGKLIVRTEDPAGFIDFISKAIPGETDERISFETIKIDGPLAIAWTPYNFYYKEKFEHCGVNSFQLVRFDGIWKIQYIIDTRRKVGCVQ